MTEQAYYRDSHVASLVIRVKGHSLNLCKNPNHISELCELSLQVSVCVGMCVGMCVWGVSPIFEIT